MTWFKKDKTDDKTPETEEPTTDADKALADAQAHLEEVESYWPAVRSEAAWHRWRRPQNHFTRDLEELFSGRNPTT